MDIITGKILKIHHWPEGKIIGLAKAAAARLAEQGQEREAVLAQLDAVRNAPGDYLSNPIFSELAREVLRSTAQPAAEKAVRSAPLDYPIWGRSGIDSGSLAQMDAAMRLPIAIAGALMPDAHVGYGLPIGGVLAVDQAVIPFAVGVDIACRMRLSLFPVSPYMLGQQKAVFENALRQQTRFGVGAEWKGADRPEHAVLDDPDWQATAQLKSLVAQAERQLGTSGSGNHFVEWGRFRLYEALGELAPGEYLALLSHSGSRGIGYKIADRYSKLAMQLHPDLDQNLRHLAWLDLNSEPGQEYWLSMQLAGRFAAANHAIIHQRVAAAAGLVAAVMVENHHNFAWKEQLPDGREVIVHRKGATPAGAGVLGIIPGSMGDAGYLVRGKGAAASLASASHGAGRKMSRKAALDSISKAEREAYLKERGVTLLGGGMDESPQAYKPIDEVMAAQQDLVEVIGKFSPRIVLMANEAGQI